MPSSDLALLKMINNVKIEIRIRFMKVRFLK